MNTQMIYGILFMFIGVLSLIMTVSNKQKKKGIKLTLLISIVAFILASVELISI